MGRGGKSSLTLIHTIMSPTPTHSCVSCVGLARVRPGEGGGVGKGRVLGLRSTEHLSSRATQ